MTRPFRVIRTFLKGKVTTHLAATDEESPAKVAPRADPPAGEPPSISPAAPTVPPAAGLTPAQIVFRAAGTMAFLYFARAVVLPIVIACVAGMTLKPLIRWLSYCHLRPPFGAAIVLGLLVTAVGIGFVQVGRPAVAWMDDAPDHMEKLRQRVQGIFRHAAWVSLIRCFTPIRILDVSVEMVTCQNPGRIVYGDSDQIGL